MRTLLTLIFSLFIIITAAESNGNGTDGNKGLGNNGIDGSGNTGHEGNNGNGDGANGNNKNKDKDLFVIDAKSGINSPGVSIGMVNAGQTITFQYVSGEWTAWPKSGMRNPDVPGNNKDSNCPTPSVCIRKGIVNKFISKIGVDTANKPWTITMQESGEVVINMNDDMKFENNIGKLTYRITIK